MTRVCAWCGKLLGQDDGSESPAAITHGVCSPCALDLVKNTWRTARQILDLVSEPILVVDGEGVVKAANKSAALTLDREPGDLEELLSGDAIQCSNASLPGGCGKSDQCSSCVIHNAICRTLTTGEGQERVPSYHRIATDLGPRDVKIEVSTEKVQDMILLRIDSMG